MTSKRAKTLGFIASALVAGVVLSGCTVNINTSETTHQNMVKDNSKNAEIQDQYVEMFAQMMIPHHQQAVDMGTLAETRASSAAVKKLAAEIKAEQAPEIKLMQGWLKAAGATESGDSAMGMGNGISQLAMDGMLNDAQLAELKAASGAKFDKLFMTDMIAHHEGAIRMAKMALKSNNEQLTSLAKAIVKSQTAQIKTMKALLAK